MNYHTDKWIMEGVQRHYNLAKEIYGEEYIVGIFLCGSQNYGLDSKTSDIDTKLIIVPSLSDIVHNYRAVSFTHMLPDGEQMTAKDIRLYIDCLKKQNFNFIETLFTPYRIINPMYEKELRPLLNRAETIARYDEEQAVRCLKGIIQTKYNCRHLQRPKDLTQMMRAFDFLERYIKGEKFVSCLSVSNPGFLLDIKSGKTTIKDFEAACDIIYKATSEAAEKFVPAAKNEYIEKFLDDINEVLVKKGLLKGWN